nr:hypothetical protein [Tanacetum cinerariifolium]
MKLEKRNKLKVFKLRILKKVGSAQRIDTSDDTVMDDVSKQGRIIKNIDADEDVVLEDAKDVANDAKDGHDADDEDNANIQERTAESQVEIYKIDLDMLKSTTITAADVLILAATTAAATTLTAAPSRRTKGVLIRDPQEESATPSTIILKPNPRIKMDYFKGMYYDDIRPIFEKHFDSNVAFLQKIKEQIDEEYSRALKRLNESQKEKAAKKQKMDEEVEVLKRHLHIVPNDDDDKNQRSVHGQVKVKSWKLLESCGVHIITFITTQLIFLVEMKYPLTRLTLDQMLNNVRLEVEEESEVSLELLSFGVNTAEESQGKRAKCLVLLVKDLVLPSQVDVVD